MPKKEKVYALKSYTLLKQARQIFGTSMVKDAWKLSMYTLTDKDYWLKQAKKPYPGGYGLEEGVIDVGGIDIVLLFSNGKYVQFGSSEWGSICAFSKEMVEIE